MATILKVLSVSGNTTILDNVCNHDVKYFTLGDQNPASGNRYYVCLSGKAADIDWQVGDCIMVELSLLAYKSQGQWQINHCGDSINLVEIGIINNKKAVYEKS